MLFAELDYSATPKTMTEDQQAAMLAFWPGFAKLIADRQKNPHIEADKIWDVGTWDFPRRQRLTLEEAHGLEIAGIKMELTGVDGTMLTKMVHRDDKYGAITPMELTSGQVVQIAVPDLGLLMINEVDWLEDACTQDLQRKLNDGWRILAVCPPNAQRRPDYILGRQAKDKY